MAQRIEARLGDGRHGAHAEPEARDGRPDPDALLDHIRGEDVRSRRGTLKVFFGACAGVGKTYAMLEAARRHAADGRDVVVGWVETHGREETEALLRGLPAIPPSRYEHRGTTLAEFDLDAALARRPSLLLLDELAHSNAPGARHAKRWQDAQEILEAGIDVYTTLNVQHLESLNDVVAQITGVAVRETVPDSVLERADEVELVDLPPDDLLQRFRDGKVYVPEQAERAVRGFFRKGNLMALRELALRRTAERVDDQMRTYRRDHGIAKTWPAAERLLVCVGPNPASIRLIRATRRMAAGLRAEWVAVYVETPLHPRLPDADREALARNLRLAEDLGGRTVVLSGHDVSEEVLAYARAHNATKIVAGKPTHPRWRDRLRGSLVDEIVRGSGDIDVYVISGDESDDEGPPAPPRAAPARLGAYARATVVVAACTLVSWVMSAHFATSNLVMVYLLGVAFVATRYASGPAVLASILSVAVFDFFFVPPHLTFAVADTQYLLTFAIMLAVALLISNLASRVREQSEAVRQRERRTATLFALSRDLAATPGQEAIARAAARHVADIAAPACAILLPRSDGRLVPVAPSGATFTVDPRDEGVARWVFEHGRMAGAGTSTLPGAGALFVPMTGTRGTLAVLGVRSDSSAALSTDQLHLLEAVASQTAAALERARLAEEAQRAQVDVETERLRNALLSSVSHDLRTPLAAITGAASTLLEDGEGLPAATRGELTEAIYEEAERLNRLVRNLLDMTRLQAGAVHVSREWHSLEELVGAALNRLDPRLREREVVTRLPEDLPLVPLDAVLIEQVLVNLLENALKYAPRGAIEVSAWRDGGAVVVEVADRGPGIPAGEEERVFDKFHRAAPLDMPAGVGLGLTVCRGIVTAHGGRIWAENREDGGAAFRFSLPLGDTPPPVLDEVPEGGTA
jgi:two-component system sensor histidine kinase KdpD